MASKQEEAAVDLGISVVVAAAVVALPVVDLTAEGSEEVEAVVGSVAVEQAEVALEAAEVSVAAEVAEVVLEAVAVVSLEEDAD
jgi:hypothetical protein